VGVERAHYFLYNLFLENLKSIKENNMPLRTLTDLTEGIKLPKKKNRNLYNLGDKCGCTTIFNGGQDEKLP